MRITTYGTRGSNPVAGKDFADYGGNTTCIQVASQCIPNGQALAIDMGTGFTQLSRKMMGEGVSHMNVLMTHYHHDHIQGVALAPHVYVPTARMTVWGPKEHGVGAGEALEQVFHSPFFPVEFALVRHRFVVRDFAHIGTHALIIHPTGGFHLLPVNELAHVEAQNKQIRFSDRVRYDISECLVVRMWKTTHPEYTVSYRFEERPTGKVFVFLTDHEKTAGFPVDMLRHVRGAHLLIQDGQYTEERYATQTSGFGHGTPEYCVDTMVAGNIPLLGITHHDPFATDHELDTMISLADKYLHEKKPKHAGTVFGCKDFFATDL